MKNKTTEQHLRNKITLLTFICSILVIYIHAYNGATYGLENAKTGFSAIIMQIEHFGGNSIAGLANNLFFFISGLLFFRTFEIRKLKDKWLSRIKTILIPYILWCSIYYLYYVVVTHIPFVVALMNGNDIIELSLSTWVRWLWVDKYFTLWFLQDLVVLIALTPVLWILFNNHLKKVPTGLIALIVVLVFLKMNIFSFPYSLFYIFGAYIGMNHRENLFQTNKILSYMSLIYVIFMVLTNMRFRNMWTQLLLYVAFWFALDLVDMSQTRFPWWMSITFFTYVSHDLFLEIYEKLFFKIFGNAPIFALLDYILMPLLTFVTLVLIAFILKKRMPHVWRVLTGAR